MQNNGQELTVWDLKQLEAKPKTFLQRIGDRGICLLPFLVTALIIIEYKFIPHFKNFTSLDQNRPTNVYAWFIGIFAAVFLIWNVLALLSRKAGEKLRHNAPIYASAFSLLLVYDLATLKTAALPLPYFPWPDAILNAIVSDRKVLWESNGIPSSCCLPDILPERRPAFLPAFQRAGPKKRGTGFIPL
jgi:NitT/TauT family transport system permease protein